MVVSYSYKHGINVWLLHCAEQVSLLFESSLNVLHNLRMLCEPGALLRSYQIRIVDLTMGTDCSRGRGVHGMCTWLQLWVWLFQSLSIGCMCVCVHVGVGYTKAIAICAKTSARNSIR